MVDSLYSAITNIEQAQSQKEVTANEAFDRISAMVAATLSGGNAVITSGNFVPTSANPSPEWQDNVRFVLSGTPGTPREMECPSGAAFCKVFVVQNDSDSTVTVQVGSGPAGTTEDVLSGSTALLYSDGTDISSIVTTDVASVLPTEDFIFIPTEGRITPTAAGGAAALATVATAADQPDVTSIDFNQTTVEHAQLRRIFDDPAFLGNVSFQFLWSHAGATTFGVAWNVKAVGVSNDDTLAVNFETARKVVDTGGTTDDHYLSERTGFVKVLDPLALDYIIFDVFRDPVDAADDLDVDARLQGVIINFWRDLPLDPDWASVSLLAGFDAEDADTTVDDESDNAHVATYGANAQVDTVESQFSRGSLLSDGTGDFVSFPDDAVFDFAAGLYTIEGWFRWNADAAAFQFIQGHWLSTGSQKSVAILYDGTANNMELFHSTNGSTSLIDISAAFVPDLDRWYYLAADFDGTTYRLYIDGVVVGTSTTLRTLHNSTAAYSICGQTDGAFSFNGHADDVRVYKGVAKYGGAFTPPTAPHPRG